MKKQKTGFTLIELLAVIVILAVIALIATASIISIINRAEKGALEDSAYGIIEAGNAFYIDHVLPGSSDEGYERINFEILGGKFVNVKNKEEALAFKGSMPKTGKLQINANGDTAIAICSNKYCACKSVSETRVTVQKEDCEIDEETGEIGTKKDTTPVGTVISFIAGGSAPDGYLACDGSVYNVNDYPKLAEAFKDGFGMYNYFGGDGVTTFAVPDLRGEFLRGTGANSHVTQTGSKEGSGLAVGVHQSATQHLLNYIDYAQKRLQVAATGGTGWIAASNTDSYTSGNKKYVQVSPSQVSSGSDANSGTYASRPTNTSVLYCIKY